MATFKINEKNFYCPVKLTLDTIGGKWKGSNQANNMNATQIPISYDTRQNYILCRAFINAFNYLRHITENYE